MLLACCWHAYDCPGLPQILGAHAEFKRSCGCGTVMAAVRKAGVRARRMSAGSSAYLVMMS